jgi:tetratricopeptide (TPR) repeat protein
MYPSQIPMLRIICMAFLFCGFAALPSVPQTVRSASAENLNGKTVDPFASGSGRVVVLLFVRTDCPISNRYAPTIRKLREKFQGKTDFWLVYPDAGESAGRIRTRDEQFHFVIPALRDVHRDLVALLASNQIPEAIAHLTAAATGRPEYFDAHYNLGIAQATAGNFPAAAQELTTAVKLKPDDAGAEANLGAAFAGHGETQKAILHLNRVL